MRSLQSAGRVGRRPRLVPVAYGDYCAVRGRVSFEGSVQPGDEVDCVAGLENISTRPRCGDRVYRSVRWFARSPSSCSMAWSFFAMPAGDWSGSV